MSYKSILKTKRLMFNFKGFKKLKNIHSFIYSVALRGNDFVLSFAHLDLTPQDLVYRIEERDIMHRLF